MRKLKLFSLFLMLLVSLGQVWADTGSITFDFEDDGAHRSNGNNSYAAGPQSYSENSCTISCAYMDVVTTGTPLAGSANALGRVAKKTTNSPVLTIGPINMSNKTIKGISYYTKGVAAMTQKCEYSTNGSSWTDAVSAFTMPTAKTQKSSGTLTVTGTTTFYIKITTTVSSADNNNNRDLQIDDVVISYETSGGSSKPTISVDPEDATYGVGDQATALSVTAAPHTSGKTLNYNWYSNSSKSTEGATQVGTDETCTPSTSSAGTTYYYCVVSEQDGGSATSGFATVQVKNKYTVTWNINGDETTTTQVVEGAKPTFPSTPVSCDGSSTTFIGWATDKWDGKLANLTGKTVHTSNATMDAVTGAVTYYAVFAHVEAGSGAAVEEDMLYEDFSGFNNSDVPTASNNSTTVYDDGSVTYTCVNGTYTQSSQQKTSYTKVYAGDSGQDLAGGASPELLIGKNNGTFTISGIPTGSATVLSLSYQSNYNPSLSSTTTGVTFGTTTPDKDANKLHTTTINIPANTASFNLTFTGVSGNNVRLDNILIEVATAGSTSTTSDYMTTCVATTKCATPTFGVAEGTYNTAQSVTLSCGTAGATIKYTTDGTAPSSTNGTVYSGAITVDKDMTIRAYAYKDGLDDSDPAGAAYVLKPKTPVISGTENFWGTTEVSITCATDGAAIYYKLNDGAETLYENPFTIDDDANIKAVAKKTDWTNSEEASADFTKIVPLTVAQAIAQINLGTDLNDRYVTGIVSQVDEISTQHGNATYWISDDGTSAAFEVYRGKDFGKTNFTASTDLIIGDVVVVKGQLFYYSTDDVYEVKNTPEIIERTKRVVSLALSNDGTAYPVEFTKGDAFSHEHMVVTATYNSTHFAAEEVQENPACTWNGYDANSLGEQEITVSYGGQEVKYNITVLGTCTNSAVITKGATEHGSFELSVEGTQCLDELSGNVTSTVLTATPEAYYYLASVTATNGTVGVIDGNSCTISNIGANTTITAVFEPIPLNPWATVYTSNVTNLSSDVDVAVVIGTENIDALKANKSSSATFTIPAGTTNLYAHIIAWNGDAANVTISGACFNEPKEQAIISDASIAGTGSTFDIDDAKVPREYFYEIILDKEVTAPTEITITAASNKRFVIFGVNAVYPAEITLDPTSYAFGDVKVGLTKSQEFTITANAMCTGDLEAEIIGTDADKFEVSTIAANKVTVTFAPEVGEIGYFEAQLQVSCTNASVTANLTATGISATQPEISVDQTLVEFGSVPQGNPLASQAVAVTLSNISTGATALISGTAFSIDPENLAASGDITITPNTSLAPGNYSETLTISATGATPKDVTVTMTIQDKWVVTYTSNIVLANNAVVVIGGNNYEAVKAGTGSANGSVDIIVPAHTTKLYLHAAAWNGSNNKTITVNGGQEKELLADAGVKSSTPFTLSGEPQFFSFNIADNAQPSTITIAANDRFVIYGVNVDTYKRDVKVGNYGTLCVKNGGVLSGATLFEIAGKDAEKIYFDEVEGGIMEAGKPYIFLPEETGNATTTITVTYNTTNKTTAGYGNGFYGTYVDLSSATGTELDGNYVISNNRYILVDDDRVTLPAHRAYIKLAEIGSPSAPSGARRRVAISGAPAVVTDIDALNSDEAPRKVMINGQLYIILGEKMFDATGRLVK